MDRYKSINTYLLKALLESQIENAKIQNSTFCIVLFKYEVDLENAFLFKKLIQRLHKILSFDQIFYNDKDSFMVIIKNKKLHDGVLLFETVKNIILNKFDIDLSRVGITELSHKDSSDDLLKRVQRYYITSKRLPVGQIVYGNREFDFFDENSREDALSKVLKKEPELFVVNIYKGVPIKERAIVIKHSRDKICLKTSKEEVLYLKKNEQFLYLKHSNFPSIVKGDIESFDLDNFIVCINGLKFLDTSIIDRENIRIKPSKQINATIYLKKGIVGNGIIKTISVDSISIKVDKICLKKLIILKDKEFTLGFRLFSKNSIAIDQISLQANLIKMTIEEVVFLIKPNSFIKSKIDGYIKSVQREIAQNLKKNILI